jgi:hypothetical protein
MLVELQQIEEKTFLAVIDQQRMSSLNNRGHSKGVERDYIAMRCSGCRVIRRGDGQTAFREGVTPAYAEPPHLKNQNSE